MPIAASMTLAARSRQRIVDDGMGMWHTSILGLNRRNRRPGDATPALGQVSPVAYLIEQEPGSRIAPHFHAVAQFQIVVSGAGSLGKRPLSIGSMHYSNAHTPYGPIHAGGQGLAYLTLRAAWDGGARYMPAERAILQDATDRVPGDLAVDAEPGRHMPGLVALAAVERCGLGIWRCGLAAGARQIGPDPAQGLGQFWIVMVGALLDRGQTLSAGSCIFVPPDEPCYAASAGDVDTDLLVVQFPRADVPRKLLHDAIVRPSA